MGIESHYHSKKDRVFVRGIQGHYNLKEELVRLRSLPRVIKGKTLKFVDPRMVLDEDEKWGKLYNEIIIRQAR